VTLGIMFLMLAIAEGRSNRLSKILSVYGKVPLFYFLLHFFVIHLLLLGLMFFQGINWSQMDFASGTFGRPKGVPTGVELAVIYFIWIVVVVILYKPCVWYGKYKTTHKQWWLKYL
jgi:predicted acyltransferase